MTDPLSESRLAEIRERDRDDDLARYYWSDTRDLLAEIELLQRGARTLGEIVDRQAVDICRIANVPMPDDGDADYALAWDRVAEMAAEVDRLTRDLEGLRAGLKFCQEGADETGRIAERAERELAEAQGKVARVELLIDWLERAETACPGVEVKASSTARNFRAALSGGPS